MKLFQRRKTTVHQVTDAQPSLTADIRKREISYVIKMSIRVVCLILAVAWPGAPLWLRGIFIAGAVLLPYLAVIGANERGRDLPPLQDMDEANQTEIPRHRREIGS